MFQPDEKVLGTPTMPLLFSSLPWMVGNKELMMLLYTFLSWLILWMNWMNRMSPDNLSINLCQTSNLDSRQFSHLNKRFSVETTEKSQIMIIDSTFYEEYQHQCWRNKNPWQRSWQRYRGGVDPVLIPDLRQLLLVDLNVPHGHLQCVPLRIYQLLCRILVK